MERKLTTILAADVVGYSRLMGEDEAATLAALQHHRGALIEPKAAQYGGRVIKLMGDGILMEFASVVAAVTFAVEVQCAMGLRNIDVPKDRQILFRIGINIGDVIIDGDDIHGDGVNIASRLEGLAESGGICVGRNVHTEVRDKLELDFRDLGEIEVKNIARPVNAFSVVLDWKAAALVTPVVDVISGSGGAQRWRVLGLAGVAALAIAAGVSLWLSLDPPGPPAMTQEQVEASLLVLPFEDLSPGTELGYFADGMTEDIITELSKNPDLAVVSRNSSFAYKGRALNARALHAEMGVKYVLEGSVRKRGDKVRITAQLIDAAADAHVWAESFDEEDTDIFALQDRVTEKIGTTLGGFQGRIRGAEFARVWQMDAAKLAEYDYYLRGHSKFLSYTYDGILEARRIWSEGLRKFPQSGLLRIKIGWTYFNFFAFGWTDTPEADLERAYVLAQEGLRDPRLPRVGRWNGRWLNAFVQLYYNRDHLLALDEARVTLEIVPKDQDTRAHLANVAVFVGAPDLAIDWAERAIRTGAQVPSWYHVALGQAHHLKGDCPQAVAAYEKLLSLELRVQLPQAECYIRLDRRAEAETLIQTLMATYPGVTLKYLRQLLPYQDQSTAERLLALGAELGLTE